MEIKSNIFLLSLISVEWKEKTFNKVSSPNLLYKQSFWSFQRSFSSSDWAKNTKNIRKKKLNLKLNMFFWEGLIILKLHKKGSYTEMCIKTFYKNFQQEKYKVKKFPKKSFPVKNFSLINLWIFHKNGNFCEFLRLKFSLALFFHLIFSNNNNQKKNINQSQWMLSWNIFKE